MRVSLKQLCMGLTILSASLSLRAQEEPITADHAFAFIEDQVIQLRDSNNVPSQYYFTPTNTDVDPRGSYQLLKGHLYSNALAAIALTHRGFEESNQAYLDKAAGILRTFNRCQYQSNGAGTNQCPNYSNVAGAFPNQMFSDEYLNNQGPFLPYTAEYGALMVRHGNNSWYLMALSYYTLVQRERLGQNNAVANEFVPNLIALADYLSSTKAQDQDTESNTEGAILFGWGDPATPPTAANQKEFISTEHQTEAFAGLIYASEVVKNDPDPEIAGKQQRYLESAHGILRFVATKLYNPNTESPLGNPPYPFFFVGYTDTFDANGNREVNDGPTALDAQTWTNLAFAKTLQDVVDISPALDYAVSNIYGDITVDLNNINLFNLPLVGIDSVFGESQQPLTQPQKIVRGALWYEATIDNNGDDNGDKGVWLTGTAELAFAFRYNKDVLGIDDGGFADLIFNDMNKMVWKEGSRTEGTWTRSWLAGGFSTFSDNYLPVAEPDELGEGEKLPGIEATAWRYFDISGFNPYSVTLSDSLSPPQNLTATEVNTNSVLLNWNADALAVSYVIERDDLDEPIAYESNLDNENSLDWQDGTGLFGQYTYTVTPRDLTGNLDTVNSSSTVTIIVDNSDTDSLPDSWEQQIIDADPAFTSPPDVLPEDDWDEDGYSNYEEYLYRLDLDLDLDPTIANPFVLYVDSIGSESYDGLSAAVLNANQGPKPLIQSAATRANAALDATINIAAGDYVESSLNSTANLTLIPNGLVVITPPSS